MAGSIATAYVQVVPTTQCIQTRLTNEFDKAGVPAGKQFGKTFGKVALSTAAVGLAGLGKTIALSLTEGGALQQSLGGVETMFKENAQAVVAAADNAYKNAGISANQYMEQAVTMSAALIKSLHGDTAAAAGVADTAIKDMADNAAKMGTPLQSLQDAYQGFAKQNYTMLDNLKLGYAGTKTEMERLLADAQKLTGVKYDINNLSDVYMAIHAIQEDMGLTGVAAEEAKKTFTGSFNAMAASAKNVLANLMTGGDLQPSLNALQQTAVTFFRFNFMPAVSNILSGLPEIFIAAGTLGISALSVALGVDLMPLFDAVLSASQFAFNGIAIAVPISGQAVQILAQGFMYLFATVVEFKDGALVAVTLFKDGACVLFMGFLSVGQSVLAGIDAAATFAFNGIQSTTTSVINGAGSLMQGFQSVGEEVFSAFRAAADGDFTGVKDIVKKAVDYLKSVMDFEWSLPHIKLPHFTISGSFSLNPPSVPTFGVDWYAKGGILRGAQIFGYMGGNLLGGGEAGPEAVLPLASFYRQLEKILRDKPVPQPGGASGFHQTNNFYSAGEPSPSETARKVRNATRDMALAMQKG